ncbi:MAG: hypothetical protein FJY95_13165 [Candidatus Handelsmanbacteria bacterium]|nr:hypothetical protein [Candidatus Handelsmanbacteria bacterium]
MVQIICLGVCGIILCGGLVKWVNLNMEKRQLGKKQAKEFDALIEGRLAELEHRLSDIQEVVLAIGEKLEQLETQRIKIQEG